MTFAQAALLKKKYLNIKGLQYTKGSHALGVVIDLIVFRIDEERSVRSGFNSSNPITYQHVNSNEPGFGVLVAIEHDHVGLRQPVTSFQHLDEYLAESGL